MSALFVALGIMVLALLALLLWFVPHLLQQQAMRVAGETAQLREMLLDLLSEQEAVTTRQTQLGTSLSHFQDQLTSIAASADRANSDARTEARVSDASVQQFEARLAELQTQIKEWGDLRQNGARVRAAHDNEAWANLMSLLATIQERVGTLSQNRANVAAGLQATVLLEELEQEMHNLRTISEEIEMLQWRLRRSLNERESNLSLLRTRASN